MIVLHIASLDNRRASGPNINVPKNIIYSKDYAQVALYNIKNIDPPVMLPENSYFNVRDYEEISFLPEPFNRPDIVIFQGVYYKRFCQIAKWLRKNGIPYIIIPRCSMTTAAIKSHALKKRIANLLFFNGFIRNASKIQFLTKNEYNESKDNFLFKDYYVLGNGVELPESKYVVKNRDIFKVVFIGRLNVYHKGLDLLLDAVINNTKWFRENKVVIEMYGSDSDNGLQYINNRIVKEKVGDIIKVYSPVFGKEKEAVLLDADVFIHTSRLEGQPTSVIEAISCGVPLIVTPGTNMTDVVSGLSLGYVAQPDAKSIFGQIKKAFGERGKKYNEFSKNSKKYALESLNWKSIIEQSMVQYSECIGGGEC